MAQFSTNYYSIIHQLILNFLIHKCYFPSKKSHMTNNIKINIKVQESGFGQMTTNLTIHAKIHKKKRKMNLLRQTISN